MRQLRLRPIFEPDDPVVNVCGVILFLAVIIFIAWLTYRPLPNLGDGCFAVFGQVSCW